MPSKNAEMRRFQSHLFLFFMSITATTATLAQTSQPEPLIEPKNWTSEIFAGPASKADFASWLSQMQNWRSEESKQLDYSHSVYDLPGMKWTQTNFVQTQAMSHDLFLFKDGRYTPQKFLRDLNHRYGGIDSVLLWPTYPNIGIDERNQYDLTRDLPGGLPALKNLVDQFHQQNIKVLLPLNPWDNGTRDEGLPHAEAITQILARVGGDGFNGDTMKSAGDEFFRDGQKLGFDFAIEPEVGLGDDLKSIEWIPLSWGYWMDYSFVPGVDRYKWLEPRHMSHVCRREVHDRSEEIQYLWFNGGGYLSWENIWGIWNGLTNYDSEVLKRISILQKALKEYLTAANWEPHTPVIQEGIFASKFTTANGRFYSFINRQAYKSSGAQIKISYQKGEAILDLWNGKIISTPAADQNIELNFPMEAKGYGAILITKKLDLSLLKTLGLMRLHSQKALSEYSADWQALAQKIVSIPSTQPSTQAPEGMLYVPSTSSYNFKVTGLEIEQYDGVDVQLPWEDSPKLQHETRISIHSFFMDKNLVSNLEFQKFLLATNYWPADSHHFLKDWPGKKIPEGWENRPVTWVSLEDARAYASWAGKRLPHEWEWQYAAQGLDERIYPWGNEDKPEYLPAMELGRNRRAPDEIGTHPAATSPFGIQDMVGNVWQWTDEYQDLHTRAAILRGGSYYYPQGSQWYFPNTRKLTEHGKYLLMSPSLDRSGTIGFRCVKDSN